MRILHAYMLKELFYFFTILVVLFATIAIAKETLDTREDLLGENSAAFGDVGLYVLLTLPDLLIEAVPLLALFAVLFAMGMLARNHEILAMAAAGASFYRMAVPVLIFGLAISGAAFWISDRVVPEAQRRAEFIYQVRIKGKNPLSVTSSNEIFLPMGDHQFYLIAAYDPVRKVMTRPKFLTKNEEGSGLTRWIEADSARFLGTGVEDEHVWEFRNATIREFGESGELTAASRYPTYRMELEEKLDTFLSAERNPEEMDLKELRDFRDFLARERATSQLPAYEYAIHSKFAVPAACLLLSMLAFGLAVDLRTRRFVLVFSAGLVLGLVYYGMRETMQGLVRNEVLDAALAAWIPVALFAVLILALMHRLTALR